MKPLKWVALAVFAVGTAHAQAYKWVDRSGHVGYGDTPPAGATKVTPLQGIASPPPPETPDAKAAGGKDAKRGPLTPAEQELEFRRRMKEAQEAAAKAEKKREEEEAKKANCESARQSLQTLESGQRIMRVDSKGERYFISDEQRAQDTARARDAVDQWCK